MNVSASSWHGRTASLVSPPIASVNLLAARLAAGGADLIDLGQAILGIQPPPEALDGAREVLSSTTPHVYSPDPGLPELREALAAHLRDRKGVPCPSGQGVMVTCGANQAFANALFALTRPGDEILTFGPGYFDHDYTIAMAGCRKVEVSLDSPDGSWQFDADRVRAAITPRTRCVLLVSPGNPTGAVAGEAFVRELVALCEQRGLWIISDETYGLLTFDPWRHVSPAAVGGFDRAAVLGTFSKLFAMAGWRLGYLAGPDRLIEEAFKVQDALVICAPVISQRAVLRALPALDGFVSAARQELTVRRSALIQALRGWPEVELRVPQGATFGLAKLVKGTDDVAFCESLVRRTGIVAVPGSAFGPVGVGHVRFSFGNQTVERLVEAGRRLRQADAREPTASSS